MADDRADEGIVDVGGGSSLDGGGAVAPSAGGEVVAPLDGVAPAEGQNDPVLLVGNDGGGEAGVETPALVVKLSWAPELVWQVGALRHEQARSCRDSSGKRHSSLQPRELQ